MQLVKARTAKQPTKNTSRQEMAQIQQAASQGCNLNAVPMWCAVADSMLADYSTGDEFDEFMTFFTVQFGFATLFVSLFPLAPLVALLFNLLEIKATSFKLSTVFQRRPRSKTSDIGIWYSILHIVSLVAIFTNAWVILSNIDAQQFSWLQTVPEQLSYRKYLFLVLMEHILMTVKLIVNTFKDCPPWLAIEKSRRMYFTPTEHSELPHEVLMSALQADEERAKIQSITEMLPLSVDLSFKSSNFAKNPPLADQDSAKDNYQEAKSKTKKKRHTESS